jgi:protein phosphatase
MLHHPNKNIITRSLGTREDVKIDIMEVDRRQYEYIILCTDGLSDYVSKEEMLEVHLRERDKKKFVTEMVELAKARGGKDNISLIIFGGDL